jgi:hypothetical protein
MIAVLIVVGLPVADAHHDGDLPALVEGEPGHDRAHTEYAVPAADGEHVHFHQCCPHMMAAASPQLGGEWSGDRFSPMVKAGDLLAGAPSQPFRPPAD